MYYPFEDIVVRYCAMNDILLRKESDSDVGNVTGWWVALWESEEALQAQKLEAGDPQCPSYLLSMVGRL
jgi:hypothetical protein